MYLLAITKKFLSYSLLNLLISYSFPINIVIQLLHIIHRRFENSQDTAW